MVARNYDSWQTLNSSDFLRGEQVWGELQFVWPTGYLWSDRRQRRLQLQNGVHLQFLIRYRPMPRWGNQMSWETNFESAMFCSDVDECLEGVCGPASLHCGNSQFPYLCECEEGFEFNVDKYGYATGCTGEWGRWLEFCHWQLLSRVILALSHKKHLIINSGPFKFCELIWTCVCSGPRCSRAVFRPMCLLASGRILPVIQSQIKLRVLEKMFSSPAMFRFQLQRKYHLFCNRNNLKFFGFSPFHF